MIVAALLSAEFACFRNFVLRSVIASGQITSRK